MSTNYAIIPTTTATIDFSKWHKFIIGGLRGQWIIQDWLEVYKKELTGGYQTNGNCIFFQKEADAVFFKLTTGD